MTYEEYKRIADAVGELQGWSFDRMRTERDPVPWDYLDVVRSYLRPADHVLDIGTGGGERFIELASVFTYGVAIDSDTTRIEHARSRLPPSLHDKLAFEVMRVDKLRFDDARFDVVLDRHAPYEVGEVVRVLRPGGYFITQQVAAGNMRNFAREFGSPTRDVTVERPEVDPEWERYGCDIVASARYDARYFVQDVPSLVFWLKAVCHPGMMDVPESFNLEHHWPVLQRIVDRYTTPRGIQTVESRTLLIVRKNATRTDEGDT
jgi:SAM-dependent methyltransferase